MTKHDQPSERPDQAFIEDAEVLAQQSAAAGQFILKLQAPKCAFAALPGTLVQLSADESNPSVHAAPILRADAQRGWIELIYQSGSEHDPIRFKQRGDRLRVRGPVGHAFRPNPQKPRALLVGYAMGIPAVVFLAERLRERTDCEWTTLVLLESDLPFPFRARPSTIMVAEMPEGTIACMPMLEEWGIPSRLASSQGDPGCYDGSVIDLATAWLSGLDSEVLMEVETFACGPKPMLEAIAAVTERFGVSRQLLELE